MPQGKLKDISPGAVVLDYGDSPHENLTIRPTLGTIMINAPESLADVFEEEYGDAPVDTVGKGIPVTVEVPFTRLQGWDLKELFPNAIEIQSGDELIIKNMTGYAFFENSRNMVIRPIIENVLSTDRSEWVYFWHVHPSINWALGYDREGQRVFQTLFKVYPVQTGTNRGRLFKFGV